MKRTCSFAIYHTRITELTVVSILTKPSGLFFTSRIVNSLQLFVLWLNLCCIDLDLLQAKNRFCFLTIVFVEMKRNIETFAKQRASCSCSLANLRTAKCHEKSRYTDWNIRTRPASAALIFLLWESVPSRVRFFLSIKIEFNSIPR
jgi:hypothetical protein